MIVQPNPSLRIAMDVWFRLTLSFLFLPLAHCIPLSDYTTLLYKACSTQTFPNNPPSPSHYSQTLDSLFQQLVAQSSQSKFFKTMEISSDDNKVISGLFQCRQDISQRDCFNCVNMLPQISNTLCSHSVAARLQLHGCYAQYETEGFPESQNPLYKDCGEPRVEYVEFRELMDPAFAALESGILNSNGFYSTLYGSVELMGQCEGDLDACKCSECISEAVEVAQEQCAASLSGQIYLAKCFMTYSYQPQSYPGLENNNSNNTQKLAAIVVGGAALICVGFFFLLFLKSRCGKHDCD